MSSDVLARVRALHDKADELRMKGHNMRAAENYGLAAAAARALGADNVVVVHMQLQRVVLLVSFTTSPLTTSDPRILLPLRSECLALLTGAMEALGRRRTAGTLLEGKCTKEEEAWLTGVWQRGRAKLPASTVARLAALAGYEEFLSAARYFLAVLSGAFLLAADCSDALLQAFTQHVVTAAELMQQPRCYDTLGLPVEGMFTDALRDAVALAGARGLDARLVQQLESAWQRLQRSGVLQARRIEDRIRESTPVAHAMAAAVLKSMAAPDLRSCALPGCGAKEAHPAHFKSCAACRTVVYCCREHQVAGWPAHKKACKAARKAAAEEEDGAGPSGA